MTEIFANSFYLVTAILQTSRSLFVVDFKGFGSCVAEHCWLLHRSQTSQLAHHDKLICPAMELERIGTVSRIAIEKISSIVFIFIFLDSLLLLFSL